MKPHAEPDFDEMNGNMSDADTDDKKPSQKPISASALNSLKSALASRRGPRSASPLAKKMASRTKQAGK